MTRFRREPGSRIDAWCLREPLGVGGNAEVWRADGPAGEVALKILNDRNALSERYRRFASEIEVLRSLEIHPGILPILAYSLPSSPTRASPAWLAMPPAIGIRDSLGEEPTLRKVVTAIQSIAQTLAQLQERGIIHRDIKPENLYSFEGKWCVGDFGLVDYPTKEALTVENRRFGPLYYHAPECLIDPNSAGKPADVFSLAKTLWVLATNQRYPYPGHLPPEVVEHCLSTYCSDPNCRPLELLIGRATHLNPGKRPTMDMFAAELNAWLSPAPTPLPAEMGEEMTALVETIIGPHRHAVSERQRRVDRGTALCASADAALKETILPAIHASGLSFHQGGYGIEEGFEELACISRRDVLRNCGPRYTVEQLIPRGTATKRLELTIGIQVVVTHDGHTTIVAFLATSVNVSEIQLDWVEEWNVDTETALEDVRLRDAISAMSNHLPRVLQIFLRRVDSAGSHS
jgi:serine/threonine protein kinase